MRTGHEIHGHGHAPRADRLSATVTVTDARIEHALPRHIEPRCDPSPASRRGSFGGLRHTDRGMCEHSARGPTDDDGQFIDEYRQALIAMDAISVADDQVRDSGTPTSTRFSAPNLSCVGRARDERPAQSGSRIRYPRLPGGPPRTSCSGQSRRLGRISRPWVAGRRI